MDRPSIHRYKIPTRPSQHEKHPAFFTTQISKDFPKSHHSTFVAQRPPTNSHHLSYPCLILLSFPHPLRHHAIALFNRQRTTAKIMAQVIIGIAGTVASIAQAIQSSVNRHADHLERRRRFTQETVRQLSEQGYNAVVVAGGWKALGHTQQTEECFEGITYTVFAAPQGQVMIVENRGDGGYENWALQGTNWVRWGNIVKFHTHYWNEGTMGNRFEVRNQNDFPGWFL
ncbi:hypothetical protein B0T10DRAFT_487900 [Thelonectria olida]|uniref:Uncharacterized protein n=1 Tax=Thelonectria olida TaxID=1576542 RepID=A0A9P8W6E4_9HYPO|nr:hypothetical protein B0T10DRAFT_487900 [Thelonectria olida]